MPKHNATSNPFQTKATKPVEITIKLQPKNYDKLCQVAKTANVSPEFFAESIFNEFMKAQTL